MYFGMHVSYCDPRGALGGGRRFSRPNLHHHARLRPRLLLHVPPGQQPGGLRDRHAHSHAHLHSGPGITPSTMRPQGNLDKRGYGDIDTLTVKEYLALGRSARLKYRLYRSPVVLLGLGPLWLMVKQRFHTPGSAGRREILGVHLTNATAAALIVGFSLLVGPLPVLAIYATDDVAGGSGGHRPVLRPAPVRAGLLGTGRCLGLRHRSRRGELAGAPAPVARLDDGQHRLPPRPPPESAHPELQPAPDARREPLSSTAFTG